ncbi:MAG: hypothetical protein AB8B96_07165 [Lysobacterales bacterium]
MAPESTQSHSPVMLRDAANAATAAIATVFVDWPGEFDLAGADPGPELLRKILAATGRDPTRFSVYRVYDMPPTVPGPVLWFTSRPVSLSADMLALPSLAAMLADGALKRTAWQRLKPWMANLP